MFIKEKRIDSDETGNEVNKDSEGVNKLLEGTADTIAEFLRKLCKKPVFQIPCTFQRVCRENKRRHKEVFCKLCKKPLNYTGSMTNMIVHLQ